ncbi:MAG: hypothetical protein WA843_00035 [Candidatus Saccharimonadales bacterium]
MAYRSTRFSAGEMRGIDKAWAAVDGLEKAGVPVRTEVMAGKSYRRQLHRDTTAELGEAAYVLQAVLQVPPRDDGKRIHARYFVEESRRLLGALDLPGEPSLDEGGLNGLDPTATKLGFGSTGTTEKDILAIYAPWVSSEWQEAGKRCMVFCGIEPPTPTFLEDHPVSWSEWEMRRGMVVFKPTPDGLETY